MSYIFNRYRSDDNNITLSPDIVRTDVASYYAYRWFPGKWTEKPDVIVKDGSDFNSKSWEMWDITIPDFFAKKKAGVNLPVNPLIVNKITRNIGVTGESSFSHIYQRGTDWYGNRVTCNYVLPPQDSESISLPPLLYLDIEEAKKVTLVEAAAAMKGSYAQTMVSVAEFHKTAGLLVDGMYGFLRVLQAVNNISKPKNWSKKGVRKISRQFARLLGSLGDVWMGARFGIRPTLYDIEDHQKALVQIVKKFDRKDTVSKHRRGEGVYDEVLDPFTTLPGLDNFGVQYGHRTVVQWRVSSGYRWKVDKGVITTLSQSFGLHRVGTTIWELVPLSWCIDYFANVSDTIAAQEDAPFLIELGKYTSIKYTVKRETYIASLSIPTSQSTSSSKVTAETSLSVGDVVKTVELERVEREIADTPSLIPSLRMDLDWMKLTDLAIVLRNITKLKIVP